MGMFERRDKTSMIALRAHPWSWKREASFCRDSTLAKVGRQARRSTAVVNVRPHGWFSFYHRRQGRCRNGGI